MQLSELIHIPVVVVPLPFTGAAANLAYQRVLARHPTTFERLEEYGERSYGFVPTDLPVIFIATPNKRRVMVRRKPLREALDVRVDAPFGTLLRLLQGEADGDALFFSRDIRVEGDMEALLALRNSLDDARVDLAVDLFGQNSPLAAMARTLMRRLSPDATREAKGWN